MTIKFIFPDSQDQIDPRFDFISEQGPPHRVRQRDDLYAHEALAVCPYDGILLSKAIVDGVNGGGGRYTLAQRHRLYRLGIREFFRLDDVPGPRLVSIGDCGAFTYVDEEIPPYSVDEVIDFYEECGLDLGISVDHIILGFRRDDAQGVLPGMPVIPEEWVRRQELTIELAAEFIRRTRKRKCRFEPVGVAQAYSPASYRTAVGKLQRMGYRRIALGGLVPLKTPDILASLTAVATVRDAATQLHLLGVTRCDQISAFAKLGVTSFDSTSPFRQAFMDDRDNYYTLDRTYAAIRVPQVEGNAKLKARILAGDVSHDRARALETRCLAALRDFDRGKRNIEVVLRTLGEYSALFDPRRDRTPENREILQAAPWRNCSCGICETAGVDVVIFRGTERNKRRGFHNLMVFRARLERAQDRSTRKAMKGARSAVHA